MPKLSHLYHQLRAVPLSEHVYVGWDSPVEFLNGAITDGVSSLVSESRIEEFVANYAFMNHNYAALLDMLEISRPTRANMRDMDANVARMKDWLITHIGATWDAAVLANANSKLGISTRGQPPWKEMRSAIYDVHSHRPSGTFRHSLGAIEQINNSKILS